MIIGYDFFALGLNGNVYDTALSVNSIDEVAIGAGIYDEMLLSVDTSIEPSIKKPTKWSIKTVIDAKFKGDLEAGTLDADGHTVNKIQVYRRKYQEEKEWLIIGEAEYDPEYNVYSFVDRFTENGATYEYATVPVANKIVGDLTVSEPIKAEFDGIFISDINGNFKMELDLSRGDTTYNNNSAMMQPLNKRYPIVIKGKQRYKSGSFKFLPLSETQLKAKGTTINGAEEYGLITKLVNFLEDGRAKVLRNSNGELIVASLSEVSTAHREGGLEDLADVSFNYVEIGELDNETMARAGLISSPTKSRYGFDNYGEVDWSFKTAVYSSDYRSRNASNVGREKD